MQRRFVMNGDFGLSSDALEADPVFPGKPIVESASMEPERRSHVERLRRPTGVTILSILNLIGGVVYVVLALGAGALTGDPAEAGAVGAVYAVLGTLTAVVAIGLLKLRNWARITAIVMYSISAVLGLIGLLTGDAAGILQLIIPASLAAYLCRSPVKDAFLCAAG
jgi:hypothetical protein